MQVGLTSHSSAAPLAAIISIIKKKKKIQMSWPSLNGHAASGEKGGSFSHRLTYKQTSQKHPCLRIRGRSRFVPDALKCFPALRLKLGFVLCSSNDFPAAALVHSSEIAAHEHLNPGAQVVVDSAVLSLSLVLILSSSRAWLQREDDCLLSSSHILSDVL